MKTFVGLLCLFGLLQSGWVNADIHAVLIAGSNGWWNYRHQADVAHAYQVLTGHGVKTENIITVMYDDVAGDWYNPFPGKLFNQPNGKDVYAGVKVDYSGEDVTPENVMAILKGDSKGVKGGNGRVLQSTKNDKVFIFYTDHGNTGLIAVIWDIITAKELNQTLNAAYDKGLFSELVFYLEACESGSMFENILSSDINVLALTASNATESSWGCYCDDPVLGTCLGDLFSVSWMEDSDVQDLTKETLQQQYEVVKKKTTMSNVMKYGDFSILPQVVGNFQGLEQPPWLKTVRGNRPMAANRGAMWASRDIPLKTVESQLKTTTDPAKRAELEKQLSEMKMKRMFHDMHSRALVNKLLGDKPAPIREMVLTHRPSTVTKPDCHHEALHAYHQSCFNFGKNPYAMQIAAPLANACEYVETQKLVETIKSHCEHKNLKMVNIH